MEHINQLMKWQSQITDKSGSYADMDVAKRLLKHGIESLQENEKLKMRVSELEGIVSFDSPLRILDERTKENEKLQAQVAMLLDTLSHASTSLGSFCSDEGWGQSDMDTLDSVDAAIASAKNSYVSVHWLAQHDQQVRDAAYENAALHFNSKPSYEVFGDTVADEIRNLKGTVETGAKSCQIGNSGQK